jgi:4-amino-4-deoxy-L-arabinose transferase-like glycosyltransferase
MAIKRLWGGIFCALLFFLLGCLFMDRAGLQTDEALFAAPLFRDWKFFSILLGRWKIPVMNMSYIGALKTWIYAPILLLGHPSPVSIRLPVVALGAVVIALFWLLLDRVHGRRAAWVGCLLLATDTSFLLTTTYDWGPVVLQHLLLIAAMLFAVRWFQKGAEWNLSIAAFCCGLAFWDKAIFIWVVSGVLLGLLIFLSTILRRLTWRAVGLALAGLFVGALPLIVYNLSSDPKFSTIRSNSHFRFEDYRRKIFILRGAWNGWGMLGYVVNYDSAPQPRAPQSAIERVSFKLHAMTGDELRNRMEIAAAAALLLLPLLWRTRARNTMLFALTATCVAWFHMTMAGGGVSVHHVVLLWPLAYLFIAPAFAEASQHVRFGAWILAAVVVALATSNLLVTNQFLYQFIRNGPTDVWTDAIYPLASAVKPTHASQVMLADWGLADSLCVLTEGSPTTRSADDPFLPAQKPNDMHILADPNAIWIEHAPGYEIRAGVNGRVLDGARKAGYEPVMLGTYHDRNGRAVFETLRFVKK